jgi:two-component system response regulator YesN
MGKSAKAFIRAFHEVPVLLCGEIDTEDKFMLGERLKQTILERTNTRVTVGIGRTYSAAADIPISMREADCTFGHRYRTGYNAVIPIDFVERSNTLSFRYPHARQPRLVYSAIVGDYDYAKAILTELFNALAAAGTLPPGVIVNTVMGIVTSISSSAAERSLPYSSELTRAFPSAEIFQLKTIEDGFTFLDRGLKTFCFFVGKEYERIDMQLHMTAKKHVQQHYYESFSATRLAAKLGTTPDTLNRVFTDRERMPLFDYVMWVRVQNAQRHLAETATEEDVIAVQVGFDDVKYFRSIFRKYVGELPADYRAKNTPAQAD